MPSRLSLLLALILSAGLTGCSRGLSRSDLVGNYEASHAAGIERIELRADNTYTYRFTPADGNEISNTDKWEFSNLGDEVKVVMHNFYSHHPPAFVGGQVVLLGAERQWGRVRLYLSYDPDQYFSKTSR